MSRAVNRVLQCLRQAALRHGGATDGYLLQRYRDEGDEDAFAALVRRHGPMVLGVCRRVLGNVHDAEDAFQATFLVLARKADAVVPPEAVGNWLHGVAYRAALKAREALTRRRACERMAWLHKPLEYTTADAPCEALDREIARLPDVYRAAVVMCELQGVSRKEAARRLGCPEGTLSSRLAKARRLLAKGLGGPVAVAAALTAGGNASRAAVPPLLVRGVSAALRGSVSAEVALLTRGVMTAMLIAKFRWVAALLLVACALTAGTALTLGTRAAPAPAPKAENGTPTGPLEAIAVRRFEGHTDGVVAVAFSPDGKRILSGGVCYEGDGDPTARLWDVRTGKELLKLEGHTLGVYAVVFLDGGKKAATGSHDKSIRLWDLSNGAELKRFDGHESTVYGLAVSPDGKSLASCGEDGTVRLWDLASGKEVRKFVGHSDKVRSVAFSADGKKIVTGGLFSDPSVRIWNVATGAEVSKYTIETEGVASVAFSPDGKLVLAGCADKIIHVFEVSNGNERRFEGHTGEVHGAAFSADGKRILSGSHDHTVRLWDVASGKEVCRFFGHTHHVWPVVFSPDGKLGLSGSRDKTMRLWKLPR